jgi:prepilin-type processing-associated H-X9-DG protein
MGWDELVFLKIYRTGTIAYRFGSRTNVLYLDGIISIDKKKICRNRAVPTDEKKRFKANRRIFWNPDQLYIQIEKGYEHIVPVSNRIHRGNKVEPSGTYRREKKICF